MKRKIVASILAMAMIMSLGACGADSAQGSATPGAEGGKVSVSEQTDGEQNDVAGEAEEGGETAGQAAGYAYDSGKEVYHINPEHEYAGKTRMAAMLDCYVVVYDLEQPVESREEIGEEWCEALPVNQNETSFWANHNGEELYIRVENQHSFTHNDDESVIQRQENGWTQFVYEGDETIYITCDYWKEQDGQLLGCSIYDIDGVDMEEVDNTFDFLINRCTIYKATQVGSAYDYANAVDAEGNTLNLSEVIYAQDMYVDEMKTATNFTFTNQMKYTDDYDNKWDLYDAEGWSTGTYIKVEEDYTIISDDSFITDSEDMVTMEYHGMQIYCDTTFESFYYQMEVDGDLNWVHVFYSVHGSDLPEDASAEEKVTYILDSFM